MILYDSDFMYKLGALHDLTDWILDAPLAMVTEGTEKDLVHLLKNTMYDVKNACPQEPRKGYKISIERGKLLEFTRELCQAGILFAVDDYYTRLDDHAPYKVLCMLTRTQYDKMTVNDLVWNIEEDK